MVNHFVAHFYLPKEFMLTLITASKIFADFINPTYAITFSSSLTFKSRWWGIPFVNRMYDVQFNGVPYEKLPKFLHVAMPAWMAKFFKTTKQLTYGWFEFFFYDRYGNVMEDPMRIYEHEYVLFSRCIKKK
jgi:hypothetical protein